MMVAFPPGRKAGVKKESTSERVARSKIANRCDPISVADGFELIAERHWDAKADTKVHLRRRKDYRYTSDQNGLGSCAAESECNTKAACDRKQGLPLVIYNPLFTYYTTSGGTDRGSVIGHNLEHGRDVGCCPEEVWARSNGFKRKPSALAYKIAKFFRIREFYYVENIQQFVSALLRGWNIHAGYSGHAVSFCRYLKKGLVEFKNSWGNWGDNGFGTLKLTQLYFPYGAYAYKDVYSYYDPLRKAFGRYDDNDEWEECPWKPAHNQARLAERVNRYMEAHTRRKIRGMKPMSDSQAQDSYLQLVG